SWQRFYKPGHRHQSIVSERNGPDLVARGPRRGRGVMMVLAWPPRMEVAIRGGPMGQVLLPRMLDRVLDRLVDVIERELMQIPVAVVVPLRSDARFAMRQVMQHVLVEAGMGGWVPLWRVARMPSMSIVLARVPMR